MSIFEKIGEKTEKLLDNTSTTIKNGVDSTLTSIKNVGKKIDENADFFKRKEGESSTSKYIQTKTFDANGKILTNEIKDIPDQKIIQPSLKKDTAQTYEIKAPTKSNLLSSLSSLGLPSIPGLPSLGVPSLQKTKTKKVIEEKAPDFAKSEYGAIQVKETKGGFVEIFDQTPGNQRTMRLHPAGTYNQVLPDGTIQDKIVKDKVTIIDEEWNIVVGKDFVEVVAGNNKIHIKKDNQININGTSSTNIDGDNNIIVNQNHNLNVKQKLSEKVSAGKDVDITGSLTQKVSQDFKEEVSGNVNNNYNGNQTDMIGGNLNIIISGNCLISATNIALVSSSGVSMKMSDGKINVG